MFYAIMTGIALILFLISLWGLFYSNRFIVEPKGREKAALYNKLTGRIRILGQGTWFLPPWWQELARVDLNREPVHVPDPGQQGEEFRAADGVIGRVEYRYDRVSGRRFQEDKASANYGQLLGDPEDLNEVRDEHVVLAVTKIDYEQRAARVQDIVKAAVEEELGLYSSFKLFQPEEAAKAEPGGFFLIPISDLSFHVEGPVPPTPFILAERIRNAAEMYRQLAKCIQARANRKLTFVGINIVDFAITNLKPADPEMQKSLEKIRRTERATDAAKSILGKIPGLTPQEALVADQPEQLAEISKVRMWGDAVTKGTKNIGDGLKNFGRGG